MTGNWVDPHHHLWTDRGAGAYLLDDLWADTDQVSDVGETVFVECGASYRSDGPAHLRPVGETEFVAEIAAASRAGDGATIAGIVATADLSLPIDQLDEVLDAHEAAGGGLFKGIRDALSSAPADTPLSIPGRAAPDKAADEDFRRGVAHLGERGLTYDTWHYHVQNRDFLGLAQAVPGTTMVLDHFGTPLGVGRWEGKHDEVFETWSADITAIAGCENVVAKLGGLAMIDNGFGWHHDETTRPDVDTFLAAQARWYHHTIEAFGPERCMFESNFPVDSWSVDYAVVWAAFEQIAERYDPSEREALLGGTARRIYRL